MAFTKWISRGFSLMALASSLLMDVEVGFAQPVSFTPAANIAVGINPFSIAVGDFNGDGKQDLAVANFNSNNAPRYVS